LTAQRAQLSFTSVPEEGQACNNFTAHQNVAAATLLRSYIHTPNILLHTFATINHNVRTMLLHLQ
jgi:hypothetical protein